MATAKKGAAKKPAAKKPAAKKGAAKKPAAKKPAEKKPAEKKIAAKTVQGRKVTAEVKKKGSTKAAKGCVRLDVGGGQVVDLCVAPKKKAKKADDMLLSSSQDLLAKSRALRARRPGAPSRPESPFEALRRRLSSEKRADRMSAEEEADRERILSLAESRPVRGGGSSPEEDRERILGYGASDGVYMPRRRRSRR